MKKISNVKELIILLLVLIISSIGLIGWSTGDLLFARFSGLYIPMAPSTAISFVFLILSLFFVLKFNHKKNAKLFSIVLASSIILLGSIILFQFLFGFNWDPENIFLKNPDMFDQVPIGRMSPFTAGLFVLYGISILLLISIPKKSSSKEKTYGVIVILSLFISTILLIGYLYNAPLLYGLNVIPVALPTAICFWLLGFALFSYMEFNFLFFINSISYVEKKLTRTLIPLILFIVIIYGFINSTFHQNPEHPAILSALLLIIIIPITVFTIYFISKFLWKSIYKAEQAVVESEKKLKDLFKHMNEGFALHEIITDDKGKPIDYRYLEINPAFTKMTGLESDKVIGKKIRDIFPGIENDPANWIEKYGEVAINGKELTFEDYSQAVGRWFIAHAFCPKKGQFAITFSDITDRKKADIELKKSEKKNKDLFENIKEGFALCELVTNDEGKPIDYTYIEVNPEFGKILGVKPDEVISKTLTEVFPGIENDNANWIEKFGEVAFTGKQISFEDYSEAFDTWFLVKAFRPQAGQFAFTFTDITDRKKVEQERHKFFMLADSSSEFIGMCDLEFSPTYVNPAGMRMVGLPDMEAACNVLVQDYFFPEDQQLMMEDFFPRVLRDGHGDVEIRLRHFQTGEAIWMYYYLYHVRDANDKIIGWATVSRNITERKKAEEELMQSEARFKKMFSNTSVGTVINQLIKNEQGKAVDFKHIDANKAIKKHLGAEPAQIVNTLASQLVSAEQTEFMTKLNEKVVNSGLPYNIEKHFDEFGKTLELSAFHLEGDLFVSTFIDITDRKLAEENIKQLNKNLEIKVTKRTTELEQKSTDLKDSQNALLNIVEDLNEKSFLLEESAKKLESANKELEAFTYSVSHDLKAPLRGIDGYSKLLLELYPEILNQEAQSFLNNIRSGTLQMNQLIEDLLAYSRLERTTVRDTEIDVKRIVNDIVENYREEIAARKIKILIDVKKIIILTDYNGLAMALRNLIENAIKFTKSTPTPVINISFIQSESDWEIRVKDNGIGFKMDYHDRIFEIFQRLHHVEDYPGTGIGLALVKKALKRMGGSIRAESKPNSGATFFIKIPKK